MNSLEIPSVIYDDSFESHGDLGTILISDKTVDAPERRRVGGTSIDGLLVHVGRASTDGFEVLEVWESKEHYDRANTDIVFPLIRELAGDQPSAWQHPDLADCDASP